MRKAGKRDDGKGRGKGRFGEIKNREPDRPRPLDNLNAKRSIGHLNKPRDEVNQGSRVSDSYSDGRASERVISSSLLGLTNLPSQFCRYRCECSFGS